MPFRFTPLSIDGLMLVEPTKFGDERGFFMETYKRSEFIRAGITGHFIQHNHSMSTRDVLRGLHYQLEPHGQGKLIRCIRGAVFDVAVDIRRGSPHFGKWVSAILSDEKCQMLYIPVGFAHGFLTLSDEAEIIYSCTAEYSPEHDRGIRWDDPDIGIKWGYERPILSSKDANLPLLRDAEVNFIYKERP